MKHFGSVDGDELAACVWIALNLLGLGLVGQVAAQGQGSQVAPVTVPDREVQLQVGT
ncbi:hypothetical protein ABZ419_21830 [Streptomyces cinnamoneus]|uniref:hypothetical protein n=1 Tax=Streptomyces cinnamoneus TaxID=53446 RepID=UPI0033C42C5B